MTSQGLSKKGVSAKPKVQQIKAGRLRCKKPKGRGFQGRVGLCPLMGAIMGSTAERRAKVEGGISIKHHRTKAEQEASLPQQTQATDATVVVPVDY
jgi:hypothetical protein